MMVSRRFIWLLFASALLVQSARATQWERFRVDHENRTISIEQDDRVHPLLGVEPILGPDDEPEATGVVVGFLVRLVGDQKLTFERDPRTSEESRSIYAFLSGGEMLNQVLLAEGFARTTTHVRFGERETFIATETRARLEHRGLWAYFRSGEAGAAPGEEEHQVYRVFYATDRAPTDSLKPNDSFGFQRGVGLTYGLCDVSIPKDHKMGELERPSIWRLQFREDPDKHVVLLTVSQVEKDAFFSLMSSAVGASRGHQALVFIHGYNVEFAEAARRTAQIAYDLSFDGAPILYSWPSRGSLVSYAADCATADWSADNLKGFLHDVRTRSGATTIHLLAHSMGNRVLTQALKTMALSGDHPEPSFNQVVLAAPDIDAQMFRDQIAPAILGVAERITLYASSEDEALRRSKQLHAAPRAGDSGPGIIVIEGMDTIDVSAIDTSFMGHSYFADNKSVITDLLWLLRERKAAADRASRGWLSPQPLGNLRYWVFSP